MEALKNPLTLDREALPPGLDPHDPEAVRAFSQLVCAQRFVHQGALQSTLLALTSEHLISAGLEGCYELGQEKVGAAIFSGLCLLDGVLRAYRIGEAVLPGPDGSRRVVAVCELDPTSGGWWLAWIRVGQGGIGVGVVLDEAWTTAQGTELDQLPEAFREWLDSEDVQVHLEWPQWRDREPDLDVRTAFVPLGDEVPPTELADLATWFERRVLADLAQRGLGHLGVMVLRRDTLEQWEIRGKLPCDMADIVRNLTRFGEHPALAAATTLVEPVEVRGAPTRGWVLTVERDGHRTQRMRPLQAQSGGRFGLGPQLGRDLGPIPEADRWIGVAPTFVMEPYLIGSGTSGEA